MLCACQILNVCKQAIGTTVPKTGPKYASSSAVRMLRWVFRQGVPKTVHVLGTITLIRVGVTGK